MSRMRIALASIVLFGLGACSGTLQDNLGLSDRAPDEFQVVRRAPLVVPPDYNLRPPGQATGAVERRPSEQAEQIVTGRVQDRADRSSGESALLARISVDAQPGIRAQLLEDVGSVRRLDEDRFLTVLAWQRPTAAGDEALDPAAAAEAILAEGRATRVVTNRVNPTPAPEPAE